MKLPISRFHLMQAIGAAILFASWWTEHFYLQHAESELSGLTRVFDAVSTEEARCDQWYLKLLDEMRYPSENAQFMEVYARATFECQMHIVSWASSATGMPGLNPESTLLKPGTNATFVSDITLPRLLAVIDTQRGIMKTFRTLANQRYNSITKASSRFRLIFMLAYIVGSLIVAVGTWREWQQEKESPNQAL